MALLSIQTTAKDEEKKLKQVGWMFRELKEKRTHVGAKREPRPAPAKTREERPLGIEDLPQEAGSDTRRGQKCKN